MIQSTRFHTLVTEKQFSRRSFLGAGLSCILMRSFAVGAQQASPQISATDLGGLLLLQGAGCNVIAMRGDDGALMIDGGLAANADALLRVVKEKTGNNR